MAEVAVGLTRPYIKVRKGQRQVVAGPAVALRLIVSEIRSESAQLLSCWYLYTPEEALHHKSSCWNAIRPTSYRH